MKKMFALILAITLVATMAIPAFADGNTTTLTTTVPEAEYLMTIPADMEITFGKTQENIGLLDVEAVTGFAKGKNVEVTVSYEPFSNEQVTTKIPYSLQFSYKEWTRLDNTPGSSPFKVESGNSVTFVGEENNVLKALRDERYTHDAFFIELRAKSSDWGAALAGSYTSTITFSAAVVAAE